MRDGTVTAIEKIGLPEKIRLCLGNGCFIAGTLVTTRSGLKPIEEIVIGDYVLSRNEETGEASYKKVIETLVRNTQEICTIELQIGKINSTTGHLFMVKNKWWKAAVKLVTGDILVTSYGEDQIVKSIKVEEKGYPVTTYNLTVEDNHTFFVGKLGILTHNKGKFNKCELAGEVAEDTTKEFTQTDEILIQRHGTLKNNKDIIGQSHHLNQDAAFREVIPREEGMAIKLEGNIFTDSEEFIMEINKDVVDRIKRIKWFKNCGNKSEIALIYDKSYAKDVKSAIKHISSTRWENVGIEEKNRLTSYLFKNYPDKYHQVWNNLVKDIKKNILPEIKENIINNANEFKLNESEIITQMEWDMLMIIMAYTYCNYMEPTFYKEILKIYENGNIPCGWKGTYPNGKIIIY